MKTVLLSENAACSLAAQLYRYYDIECDVSEKVFPQYDGSYIIKYETEHGKDFRRVKMRIFENKIEDLYLIDNGQLIEPTTTREEQEER